MFKAKGKLVYDPKTDSSKFNFWWAKVDVPQSIVFYYQYWVRKELGIKLNMPMWKSHITVIRGEEPKLKHFWKRYQNEAVEFEYSPELRLSETYVWLTATCPRLEQIRTELGLRPTPRVPFHITIGNTKNLDKITEDVKLPFKTFPWENLRIVDELWRKPTPKK